MKRPSARGDSQSHGLGLPVETHADCDLALRWCAGEDWSYRDHRGTESLRQPLGYVTDGAWKLWYVGRITRRDAISPDFPYHWAWIEFACRGSRKKSVDFEKISPVDLSPRFVRPSAEEFKRVQADMDKPWQKMPVASKRVCFRLFAQDLGVQVSEGVLPAWFRIDVRNGEARIRIEPCSTARLMLRIIERMMMHLPSKTLKDSDLEPLLRFLSFLGAMDKAGFHGAGAACADRYVAAFSVSMPEPHRSSLLRDIVQAASREDGGVLEDKAEHPLDAKTLVWVFANPGEAAVLAGRLLIPLEEIHADILNRDHGGPRTAAASPRRLRDKAERLGITVYRLPGSVGAVTLKDYSEHRSEFFIHGNRRGT